MDITKSKADAKLCYIFIQTDLLILVLCVDDLFLTGGEKLITSCQEDMATKSKISWR